MPYRYVKFIRNWCEEYIQSRYAALKTERSTLKDASPRCSVHQLIIIVIIVTRPKKQTNWRPTHNGREQVKNPTKAEKRSGKILI